MTGAKGAGKSTLLGKLLAQTGRAPGGFLTVKAKGVFPGQVSLHLLRAGTGEAPGPENFLFFCGAPPEGGEAGRFDRLGCAALETGRGAGVIVMDELGPRESGARLFHRAVLQALDGRVPVLGVLQQAESPFLHQVAAHPQVHLVEVTADNRDALMRSAAIIAYQAKYGR